MQQTTLTTLFKRARDASHAKNCRLLAERGVGSLGLPEDVTTSVLSYSDLRGVAACAAASSELKRCLARLSPDLEHRLVLRRFPLLATVAEHVDAEPRDLFYSQMNLFEERPHRNLAPTRGLDEYVFSLEIEFQQRDSLMNIVHRESVFVGTGSPTEGSATLKFHPPADRWEEAVESDMNIFVRVMATKRFEKGRARLGQGSVDDFYDGLIFYSLGRMRHEVETGPRPTSFLDQSIGDAWGNEWPELNGKWGVSDFDLHFAWENPNDSREMSVEDACLALEHYVTWV
jgi:hypothetical protein